VMPIENQKEMGISTQILKMEWTSKRMLATDHERHEPSLDCSSAKTSVPNLSPVESMSVSMYVWCSYVPTRHPLRRACLDLSSCVLRARIAPLPVDHCWIHHHAHRRRAKELLSVAT